MSDIANTNTNAMAWPAKPLGEVFWINGDQVAPMASRKTEFVHYSIPAWDATGGPAIELGSQIESNKTAVSNPAVLVSKLNPRKPRVVAITTPSERTCCSTEFICYQPKQSNEDLGFWAAYFASTDFCSRLTRVAVGSTNSHTRASPKETLKWLVPEVPSIEQHKIAQVLVTLDTAIHETEAIIAKLKAVKQGLLHDLLTRGIDANGELRPPQAEAPQLYKESALGWIPMDWEIRRLEDCASITSGVTLGRSLQGHESIELPYLRVANVQDGYVDLSHVKKVRVLKGEVDRFALVDGDVLMNEGGDYDKLGRGTVWRAQIHPCLHQNHVFRVRCDRDVLIPDYLAAYSASPRGKAFFILASKQSTNLASINSTQLKGFPIACPNAGEQRWIVGMLQGADRRVRSESDQLSKLQALKAGLMDDLLTGRVRVTPLLEGDSTSQTGQQLAGQMPG